LYKRVRTGKKSGNLVIAIQAAAIVAAVMALAAFAFDYHSEMPLKKQQRTVVCRIPLENNAALRKDLEMRDPARLFGVSGGGFTALRPVRERQKEFSMPPVAMKSANLPVAGYSPLPEPEITAAAGNYFLPTHPVFPVKAETVMISPQGRCIKMAALKLSDNAAAPRKNTVLSLAVSSSMRRCRVVDSCGKAEFDRKAADTLKSGNFPAGIYTVIWAGNHPKQGVTAP
jgi:hypothetical protein